MMKGMSSKEQLRFDEVVITFIERDGRTAGQLSRRVDELFGHQASLPRETITRWINGEVKRPRDWRALLQLGAALRLTGVEADHLLRSARHNRLQELMQLHQTETDRRLFDHWSEDVIQLADRAADAAPFQVPPDIPTFVGRDTELREIEHALFNPAVGRTCCLLGLGGVGKTALAIHAAYRLRARFPHGVLWADLQRADQMSTLQSFARALGADVSQYIDLDSRSGKVRELLAGRQVLLLLDGATADRMVRPLLPPSGSCSVIVTTRHQSLAIADVAHRVDVNPFSRLEQGGMALFSAVLGERRAREEQADLTKIADLLGHLPLALTIAANRMKQGIGWSAAAFLERLQDTELRLTDLERGDRSVRKTFQISLTELGRQRPDRHGVEIELFFRSLSLFGSEDFGAVAAAALNAMDRRVAEDHLRRLYDHSLIQLGRPGRFRLHPLLRDFGREKGMPADYYERFISHYITLFAISSPEEDGGDSKDMLDFELDNLLEALEIAWTRGHQRELIDGSLRAYPVLKERGLYPQAEYHLGHAQEAAEALSDRENLVAILHYRGLIATRQGRHTHSEAHYAAALQTARDLTPAPLIQKRMSAILTAWGALHHRQSGLDQAEGKYKEAVALADATGDTSRKVTLLTNLGLVAAERGDAETAESYYLESLEMARRLRLQRHLIKGLQNYGALLSRQGEFKKGEAAFREGLALAEEMGDPELRSHMLGNLGGINLQTGHFAEATARFQAGLALAEKIGHVQQMSRQHANLGRVEARRSRYRNAHSHFQQGLKLARENQYLGDAAIILNAWGEAYMQQDNLEKAQTLFEEAHEIGMQVDLLVQTADSRYGLARVAALRGDTANAQNWGEASRELYAKIGDNRERDVVYWLKELEA